MDVNWNILMRIYTYRYVQCKQTSSFCHFDALQIHQVYDRYFTSDIPRKTLSHNGVPENIEQLTIYLIKNRPTATECEVTSGKHTLPLKSTKETSTAILSSRRAARKEMPEQC